MSSSFVKKLASNDRATREHAVTLLQRFLGHKKSMSLGELAKLWKGLYYAMWFSDRPRPQQRLADQLGGLFLEAVPTGVFVEFVEAFWTVMAHEWAGIDQWRMDKFYMLLRRVVRHCFLRLQKEEWDGELVDKYIGVLSRGPLSGDLKVAMAIPYHVMDVWMDELERVVYVGIDDAAEGAEEEMAQARKAVPFDALMQVFKDLEEATHRTLRERVKEEVWEDSRVKVWSGKTEEVAAEEKPWTGFGN